MMVTATYDEQTDRTTLDHTWQEIDTALRAGTIVYCSIWKGTDNVTNSFIVASGEPGSSDYVPSAYWAAAMYVSPNGSSVCSFFTTDAASGYPYEA